MRLPYLVWYLAWVLGCTAAFALWHAQVHGSANGWQIALAFFLAINIVTCIQEICLGLRIDKIEHWHHDPEGRRSKPHGSFWLARVSPVGLLSATFWARMWSEYAYFDPGYADRRFFGFSIDVGNGWSTLIPSVLFLVGMTSPAYSPIVVGIMGIILFYQKLYCTSVYFFCYVFNRYYKLQPMSRVIPVVGFTNGVWIIFPAIGLYASIQLVLQNSFALLR